MNDQPITRRDMFALITYALLASSAIEPVLRLINMAVLSLSSVLPSGGTPSNTLVPTVATVVLQSLLVPLVPLVAHSAAGRKAGKAMTKQDLFSLLVPCIGLALFVYALQELAFYIYFGWSERSTSLAKPFLLVSPVWAREIVSELVQMSIGFALAFFPAIFDSLRHPDERNAA